MSKYIEGIEVERLAACSLWLGLRTPVSQEALALDTAVHVNNLTRAVMALKGRVQIPYAHTLSDGAIHHCINQSAGEADRLVSLARHVERQCAVSWGIDLLQ